MRRRIFRSIFAVTALVFVASVVLIMGVLYTHFLNVQVGQMQAQAELAAQGIREGGPAFAEGLEPEGYRLTWIDPSGKVLYDSAAQASRMENHLEREEVQQALKTGQGESSRYSTTLLQRQLYVAQRVDDGSVVRIADSQRTILGLLLGMLQQILIIAVIALALSLLLASRLTRRIVQPLNNINLDQPEKAKVYEELNPLLDRLSVQQDQIRTQTRILQQMQQEFDASTANMEEGLLIVSEQRRIISVNRAAARILDMPGNALGKPLMELTQVPEIGEALEETLSGGTREMDMELGDRQYQLHASPVISQDQITAAVIFILDVSARKEAEQMRREFTANVSHELKTPLQTISGSAELMEAGMVPAEETGEFARRIRREAGRLLALIDDIIGLSRLDEGAEDMRWEEVDLMAAAERVAAGLSQVAEEAGIRLNVTGESAMVMGDITLLKSLIHNLCENAIKYNTEPGTVDVSVSQSEAEVCLTVRDDGIGIPEDEKERIFERFYRVDKGRSKEVGGTGLGLSIVKHVVLLHKGRIEIDSRVGDGTSMKVYLPRAGA